MLKRSGAMHCRDKRRQAVGVLQAIGTHTGDSTHQRGKDSPSKVLLGIEALVLEVLAHQLLIGQRFQRPACACCVCAIVHVNMRCRALQTETDKADPNPQTEHTCEPTNRAYVLVLGGHAHPLLHPTSLSLPRHFARLTGFRSDNDQGLGQIRDVG